MASDNPSAVAVRRDLLAIVQAALAAVQGRTVVAEYLRAHPLTGAVHLVAIGKAAADMTAGVLQTPGVDVVRGLVVTKRGFGDAALAQQPNLVCLKTGHPLPDASSLAAGSALLEFIDSAPREARLLFLVSGGTSSLVDVVPAGVSLDGLRRANRWLLGSGMDIAAMNRVRKALSAIKGGKLVERLQGRATLALLISDVYGDDPAVIGSGLLAPSSAEESLTTLAIPGWLSALCLNSPAVDRPVTGNVEVRIVACLRNAMQAAIRKAQDMGYGCHLHEDFISGNAHEAGQEIARVLMNGAGGIHVWGGETTLVLPDQPGRGGRNQALALAAALELQGRDDCMLLALGSDGNDGPTDDAGALVDAATIMRGQLGNLDAWRCLANADAGTFLEASGDLIHTGPTGTNVMDLIIGLKTV